MNDQTGREGVPDRRAQWRARRLGMEARKEKSTPDGKRRRSWGVFRALIALFGIGIRVIGLHGRGRRNAADLVMTRHELTFADLPEPFDGFTILQLTDLHLDVLAETTDAALGLAAGLEIDLCVLTGDYRRRIDGPHHHILPPMSDLIGGLSARHGIHAVLGNHDCADMVEDFEALGIRVLINEYVAIARGGARLHISGTDDVHYYYTDGARAVLDATPDGFKIALVHSAEFADAAAEAGFHLYLAGHTHGGQVCLPGGRAIITHLTRHKGYAQGLWRHGRMIGYTSTGVGVSALPIRFNSRGEVALFTLRRG
jgi:hypothetical protein